MITLRDPPTVCNNNWDVNAAKVVCKNLDCGTALSAPQSALFGPGTGQIWLDDVDCSGNEGSLGACQHRGFGKHNCKHSEDAGVVCSVSLPKPSLSITPTGEATWGQKVSITCSDSAELVGGTFILTETSGSFRETQTSSTNSAVFSIPKVNFDNEGLYQCQHEKSISGHTFSSSLSDTVRLTVTVIFPKPSISMNPVGEVTWGQDVSMTCSISTQFLGGTFTLKRTPGSLRMTQTSNTNSATFSIPKVEFVNEGLYQCQYQKSSSIRDFTSPLSDSVRLSITDPTSFIIRLVIVLLSLLLMVTIICFVHKFTRGKRPDQQQDIQLDYINLGVSRAEGVLAEEAGVQAAE
ncbi:immunoglobulin superfamily member 1 [Seriola aureovittata]|uniref:immunoglobulin superfamily member 1 n=1 Tax=Seriola aureovittata TaxID=2871759 RepID=UPI0024BD9D1B|nr:immunoglobulin superfamily member 1 [Seriola aureovittata]